VPPSFTAFRCDKSGLARQLAWRTRWVAGSPLYRSFKAHFSASELLPVLANVTSPQDRGYVIKMALEHLFEAERQRIDPRLPSRVSSVFVFSERHFAEIFKRRFPDRAAIYVCTVRGWWFQGEGLKIYEAHNVLHDAPLTLPGLEAAVQRVSEIATNYWTHQFNDPGWPELLVDGEVFLEEESEQPETLG
jgi:hypothetical protein